jgi:hypothetical protein
LHFEHIPFLLTGRRFVPQLEQTFVSTRGEFIDILID